MYALSCGGFYIGGKGAVSIGGAQCAAPIPLLSLVYKKKTTTGAARCRSDTAPFPPLYKPPQVTLFYVFIIPTITRKFCAVKFLRNLLITNSVGLWF